MTNGIMSYQLVTSITSHAAAVNRCVQVETIASRLGALRDAENLSSRKFAERLTKAGYAVSHAAVLGYEKEEGGPESVPGDYLAAVCDAFGVSPEWLLLGVGPRERAGEDAESPARLIAADLLEDIAARLRSGSAQAAREIPAEAYRYAPRPKADKRDRPA